VKRMKKSTKSLWTGAAVALVGSAMLASAGVVLAGKPAAGGALKPEACSLFDAASLFHYACVGNQEVANVMLNKAGLTDAAYIGSCEGGGACAESVYNKLVSASSKYEIPKLADACQKLADIQEDLRVWNTGSAKPKINDSGYVEMSSRIRMIQQEGGCP